tara:strand:- start:377 stop:1399 length:1023 start_codon:yes stop_codon:yes gene_type:complete
VLVIGPAWIGDMVMAQCLFQTLQSNRANLAISLTAPPATARLAHRMPEIDEIIETPFQHGRLHMTDRFRTGRSLRGRHFDQAIILPGSLKAALLPFFAKIPMRTGYRKEPRWGLINDPRSRPSSREDPMAARFVQLGLRADAPAVTNYPHPRLVSRPDNVKEVFQRLGKDIAPAPVIAICPGAEFGPAKRWPERHFAALADHYLKQGWQVWLLGGEGDQKVARTIIGNCCEPARCVDLTGCTRIDEAIDLLAYASAAVSNDSGLMHVAAATGTPVVGIFGASSEHHTPPLGPLTAAVAQQLACRPCFARECPLGHKQCLETLGPDRVIASLSALLERAAG